MVEEQANKSPAERVGRLIGRAIARDVLAINRQGDVTDISWPGLNAQDGDKAAEAGIEPYTDEWEAMERVAQDEYERMISEAPPAP